MTTACRGGRRRQRGVTLIELLVALVLLSFVMSAVYGALRVGLRSWDAVQAHSGDAAEARVVRNLIRRQVDALVPLSLPEDELGPRLAFEGDAEGFRFIGAWTQPARGGGVYLIELAQARSEAQDGNGLFLRFRESALHETDWRRAGGEATERELLGGRDAIRFAYYGTPQGTTPPAWQRSWDDGAERYPRLIRIEVDGLAPLLLPVRLGEAIEEGEGG